MEPMSPLFTGCGLRDLDTSIKSTRSHSSLGLTVDDVFCTALTMPLVLTFQIPKASHRCDFSPTTAASLTLAPRDALALLPGCAPAAV